MKGELKQARAIVEVMKNSTWQGFALAEAYIAALDAQSKDEQAAIARKLYETGSYSLKKSNEIVPTLKDKGFIQLLKNRERTDSAANPITKLFPAAITEQRFVDELDKLREKRTSIDYGDERESGHTLVDFSITEGELCLPVNVKNAGTRFENAMQLVAIEPNDCIPIPAYKAHDAIEKEPNLLYAVAVDYTLLVKIKAHLLPLFNEREEVVWEILNKYSGSRIRDAEDNFIYGMVAKHWDQFYSDIADTPFRVISARKSIRILQTKPKRTPGIGLRAWGTGASAEVNVHICVSEETKDWAEIFDRIQSKGLEDIIGAINRKRTELVYDPEI